MRGLSQGSDSGNFTSRVIWEQSRKSRAAKSAAEKLVAALDKASDSVSLTPEDFAYHMTFLSAAVQRKFLSCVLKWVAFLAEKAEKGLYFDGEEKLLCEDAKVIHNATAFLRD